MGLGRRGSRGGEGLRDSCMALWGNGRVLGEGTRGFGMHSVVGNGCIGRRARRWEDGAFGASVDEFKEVARVVRETCSSRSCICATYPTLFALNHTLPATLCF